MRVHFLSIFTSEPVGGGGRVRYGGGTGPGRQGDSGRGSGVLSGSEGYGMFPVAVMAGAGWLFLFVVLLIVPPSPGPLEGGGQGEGRTRRPPEAGDVPPAVVSLLAGRLDKLGFGATLVDLAARGWFEVRPERCCPSPIGTGWPGRAGSASSG